MSAATETQASRVVAILLPDGRFHEVTRGTFAVHERRFSAEAFELADDGSDHFGDRYKVAKYRITGPTSAVLAVRLAADDAGSEVLRVRRDVLQGFGQGERSCGVAEFLEGDIYPRSHRA